MKSLEILVQEDIEGTSDIRSDEDFLRLGIYYRDLLEKVNLLGPYYWVFAQSIRQIYQSKCSAILFRYKARNPPGYKEFIAQDYDR